MNNNFEEILKIKRDSLEAAKSFVEWQLNEDREEIRPVPQVTAWFYYKSCQTLFLHIDHLVNAQAELRNTIQQLEEKIAKYERHDRRVTINEHHENTSS